MPVVVVSVHSANPAPEPGGAGILPTVPISATSCMPRSPLRYPGGKQRDIAQIA